MLGNITTISISPDKLREFDTAYQETVSLEDGRVKNLEEVRDAQKAAMLFDGINLIDAGHLSDEQIDRFEGDLRAFLLMLREKFDREKLKTAVAMHRETWYAISKVKNDKRYMEYIDSGSDEDMAGEINMDATLDYIEVQREVRGKARGKEIIHSKKAVC